MRLLKLLHGAPEGLRGQDPLFYRTWPMPSSIGPGSGPMSSPCAPGGSTSRPPTTTRASACGPSPGNASPPPPMPTPRREGRPSWPTCGGLLPPGLLPVLKGLPGSPLQEAHGPEKPPQVPPLPYGLLQKLRVSDLPSSSPPGKALGGTGHGPLLLEPVHPWPGAWASRFAASPLGSWGRGQDWGPERELAMAAAGLLLALLNLPLARFNLPPILSPDEERSLCAFLALREPHPRATQRVACLGQPKAEDLGSGPPRGVPPEFPAGEEGPLVRHLGSAPIVSPKEGGPSGAGGVFSGPGGSRGRGAGSPVQEGAPVGRLAGLGDSCPHGGLTLLVGASNRGRPMGQPLFMGLPPPPGTRTLGAGLLG